MSPKKILENKPSIGHGIYTMPDIAHILRIPYHKVSRWVKEYWDKRLSADFEGRYSWTDGMARAIGFHTLIELFVLLELSNAGVRTTNVLLAHSELSKLFKTPYPFATSKIIEKIGTDSKRIYFKEADDIIYSLDGKRQFNLQFVQDFFEKIDFSKDTLAARYYPLGKSKSIVVDPEYQFGQPILQGTNILPLTIYHLHKGDDPIDFIAELYEITEDQVKHAIEFCELAA